MRRGLTIVLSACSAAPAPAPHAPPPAAAPAPPDAAIVPACDNAPATAAPLVARVEHGACDGRCPVYDVAVYRDGTIDYFGIAHVAVGGRRVSHVDVGIVDELARGFAAVDFAKLPHDPFTFSAGAWTGTVQFGTETAYLELSEPRGIPPALVALVERIDALAGAAPGSDSARPSCATPPKVLVARIIQASAVSGVVQLVAAVGAKQGVTRAWKAELLAPDSDQPLPGGELAITRIGERQVILTLAGTEVPATTRVRLWLP